MYFEVILNIEIITHFSSGALRALFKIINDFNKNQHLGYFSIQNIKKGGGLIVLFPRYFSIEPNY